MGALLSRPASAAALLAALFSSGNTPRIDAPPPYFPPLSFTWPTLMPPASLTNSATLAERADIKALVPYQSGAQVNYSMWSHIASYLKTLLPVALALALAIAFGFAVWQRRDALGIRVARPPTAEIQGENIQELREGCMDCALEVLVNDNKDLLDSKIALQTQYNEASSARKKLQQQNKSYLDRLGSLENELKEERKQLALWKGKADEAKSQLRSAALLGESLSAYRKKKSAIQEDIKALRNQCSKLEMVCSVAKQLKRASDEVAQGQTSAAASEVIELSRELDAAKEAEKAASDRFVALGIQNAHLFQPAKMRDDGEKTSGNISNSLGQSIQGVALSTKNNIVKNQRQFNRLAEPETKYDPSQNATSPTANSTHTQPSFEQRNSRVIEVFGAIPASQDSGGQPAPTIEHLRQTVDSILNGTTPADKPVTNAAPQVDMMRLVAQLQSSGLIPLDKSERSEAAYELNAAKSTFTGQRNTVLKAPQPTQSTTLPSEMQRGSCKSPTIPEISLLPVKKAPNFVRSTPALMDKVQSAETREAISKRPRQSASAPHTNVLITNSSNDPSTQSRNPPPKERNCPNTLHSSAAFAPKPSPLSQSTLAPKSPPRHKK